MDSNQTYFLYPGHLFLNPQPHQVTTILGSCVAVCLWDPVRKVGGINHFMLPNWNGEGGTSNKFGDVATTALLEGMIGMGCCPNRIHAKVFGGCHKKNGREDHFHIGERNVEIAQEILKKAHIPIISANVGGFEGRKIQFFTGLGEVRLRFLNS